MVPILGTMAHSWKPPRLGLSWEENGVIVDEDIPESFSSRPAQQQPRNQWLNSPNALPSGHAQQKSWHPMLEPSGRTHQQYSRPWAEPQNSLSSGPAQQQTWSRCVEPPCPWFGSSNTLSSGLSQQRSSPPWPWSESSNSSSSGPEQTNDWLKPPNSSSSSSPSNNWFRNNSVGRQRGEGVSASHSFDRKKSSKVLAVERFSKRFGFMGDPLPGFKKKNPIRNSKYFFDFDEILNP